MPEEPLSNIDTAWLRSENASHPMMITMAMAFGARRDGERLRAMLKLLMTGIAPKATNKQ